MAKITILTKKECPYIYFVLNNYSFNQTAYKDIFETMHIFFYDQFVVILFFIVQIFIVKCFLRRMLDFCLRIDIVHK